MLHHNLLAKSLRRYSNKKEGYSRVISTIESPFFNTKKLFFGFFALMGRISGDMRDENSNDAVLFGTVRVFPIRNTVSNKQIRLLGLKGRW